MQCVKFASRRDDVHNEGLTKSFLASMFKIFTECTLLSELDSVKRIMELILFQSLVKCVRYSHV